MQPVVTYGVAWSVGLSICLLVCDTSEPCRNGWTDWDVFVMDSGGPKETWSKGAIFRGKNVPWLARRHSAMSCAKTAEPIQMPFGLCSRMGPRKHVWHGGTLAQPGEYDWTVRMRRRCGLMSNYFDHLFVNWYWRWRAGIQEQCLLPSGVWWWMKKGWGQATGWAAWLSGSVLVSVNEVTLHRARLVLGWLTVCGRLNHFGLYQPLGPTQPSTLSGIENEYWPKCGDAVRLGSKGRYGSFHLWINVWVQVKLWSLVNMCHTWAL